MVTILERGKIHAGERGLLLLAKQSVDSLEKGLIELVTNADESYNRLEKKGEVASGKIEISIDRHTRTKPTIIEVLDYAEGMDSEDMKCLTSTKIKGQRRDNGHFLSLMS